MFDLLVALDKKSATKSLSFIHKTECLEREIFMCQTISVWTKVVDQPTDGHCHSLTHAVSVAKNDQPQQQLCKT